MGDWTFKLVICCISVGLSSFQFGYNLVTLNTVTDLIKAFIKKHLFVFNDYFYHTLNLTESRVDQIVEIIWMFLNFLYILGGMLGAIGSKYILNIFGRRNGLIFNNIFTLFGFVLSLVSKYVNYPMLILISRFLYGMQAGVAISAVPVYLSEISSHNIRGQTGALSAISITSGIVVSQILGLSHLLGSEHLWNILLSGSIVPAIFSSLFLSFLPETPKALLMNSNGQENARKALQSLRNKIDVNEELKELTLEVAESNNLYNRLIKARELFKTREFRWPFITSLVLHSSLQLCGINSIYFYSSSIFKKAGIRDDLIQYAILSTGVVEYSVLFFVFIFIEKVGRKPLIVWALIVIIFNFVALTLFLSLIDKHVAMSYLCVLSILVFMISFGFSLGPIPYLYTAEVFRQNVRGTAVSTCLLINWISNLINTISFPILNQYMHQYVFLIYSVLMLISLAILVKKMPETKGRTIEEVIAQFDQPARDSTFALQHQF